MYFIRVNTNGKEMYLHNHRLALHLPDYARRFKTEIAALRFMKRHHSVYQGASWRIVEIPDEELRRRRFMFFHL